MNIKELGIFVARWFEEQASIFLSEHNDDIDIVSPRVDHIRRVASFCRSLAVELDWTDNDIAAIEIIGYLHDIGRFSQYTTFHTFIDAFSVNHTERSLVEVEKNGMLEEISDYYKTIIAEGIRYHNTRNFKKHVHKESVPFLRLIRDADKLEKYLTIANGFDNGSISRKILNIEHDGPVNLSAVTSILKGRKISKKHIHSQLDYHLLQLSWIFEVTHPQTIQRIKESQAIEHIMRLLPNDPKIEQATSHVSAYLDSYKR